MYGRMLGMMPIYGNIYIPFFPDAGTSSDDRSTTSLTVSHTYFPLLYLHVS